MLEAKVFMILIVQFKKHLFLLTNELKLMNLSVSDKILFCQKSNWSSVYGPNYCLSLREKIIIVVFHKTISKLRYWLDEISYQFCEDKPTQLQTLGVAKRQLMINTCNFKFYQNIITKPKSGNSHKSIESESCLSDREAMKMRCRKELKKIRHFKSVATSRICFDKLKSKYNYITCRFKSEKVNQSHDNEQIFEQCVQSKFNQNTNKYHKLIDIILDSDFLEKCYFRIKSKPGNSTPSIDGETLDGINRAWFKKISKDIKNGSYTPKPSRVVHIPKPNSNKKRRLVINSPRDKIIQEGFRGILSTIYESKFSEYSYGFRKNKNAHHALKHVKYWKDVSWFICFDIEKYFDSINRKRLINILKKDIDDQRFFDIINKMFNTKVLEMDLKTKYSYEGVPQGSVLSPIFSNVYLDELDKFMEKLMKEFNSGKERKRNQKFRSMTDVRSSKNKTVSERNRRKKEARKQKITQTDLRDPNYIRVKYARYADDFVIGISGDKKFAIEIMNKIKHFIKSDLHLNISDKKSCLISIVHRQASFLGFLLKKTPKHFNPVISQKLKGKEKTARTLKRLKHESLATERRELKKIKKNLKTVIAKSLKKNQSKDKQLSSEIIDNISQLVQKERLSELSFDKPFFSDTTLKTIMYTNKSDIPKEVLDTFNAFKQAIESNLETANNEINDAKTKGKFIDESGKEQKVVTKQNDLPIQIYAPTDLIIQRLKIKGILSKKGKPQAFNPMLSETDPTILQWYSSLARGLLNYYQCADNFYKIKSIINYQIRWSIYHTLAKKHKTTIRKLFIKHGDDFKLDEELQDIFPSKTDVASKKKAFLIKQNFSPPLDALNQLY
jgi:group II intron reverse transcriptase/maturase